MKIKERGGKAVRMSGTQCYSATDIEEELRRRFEKHSLFIDFSGENIPLCTREELRLASVLVCAYHNALVRESIQDPTYEPYKADDTEDPKEEEEEGHWKKVSNYRLRRPKGKKLQEREEHLLDEWDEEAQGERVVFDPNYEVNADLVPWRQERCLHWGIERWGLYA